MNTWILDGWTGLVWAAVSAMVIYTGVIVLCRVQGVRSFAKMSSFDFAMTIAVGSVVASTSLTSDPPLLRGVMVLVMLFAMQQVVATVRRKSRPASSVIDNEPVLVMRHGKILEEGLDRASMTRDDLFGKLREANALRLESVHAVVAESTGDVSVLHGEADEDWLSDELLRGVVGAEAGGGGAEG